MKYLIIWLVMSLITFGGANGYFQGKYNVDRRENYFNMMFISMIPPAWIVVPFASGFYEYGWRIDLPKEDK